MKQLTIVRVTHTHATSTKPASRILIGDVLAALSHNTGLTNKDFDIFQQPRDNRAAEPLIFSK